LKFSEVLVVAFNGCRKSILVREEYSFNLRNLAVVDVAEFDNIVIFLLN
jgi:hypothetical protein